jgi:hypothetical protein
MKKPLAGSILTWVVGPVVVMVVAAALGEARGGDRNDTLHARTSALGVGVTPPEALAIAEHLRQTRSPEELERITAYLGDRREKTRGLTSTERFSPDHPCPFLESARCSIYEVRPLSCRGMNSLDADDCATRLRDPDARAAFIASGTGGRSFMEPIRAFHAVSAGLQLGLSELYELDMRPLDLTAAVHLLLTAPRSVVTDWLRGLSPFDEARGSDSSGHAGIEALSGRLPGRE